MEVIGIRANGERLPVELSLTVVQDAAEGAAAVYGFIRDISERRRGEEQLAFLAYHDPLTGLPNRVLIEQQVDLALARARRSATSVALMFVDLDDFKEVNDRLGHAAGDQLLTGVAARLRGVLRDSDVLARQGGDELLILITDLSDDAFRSAEMVATKVLGSLREPFVVGAAEVRTVASIGISLFPADAADTEALLRHADAAMYQAKGQSGGRLAFHQPTGNIVAKRTSVSAQLRNAMTEAELELHYLPIWRAGSERGIHGVEALLRWRHLDRGLLRPGSFMDLADQSAVADDVIGWVLEEVCPARRRLARGRDGTKRQPQHVPSPAACREFRRTVRRRPGRARAGARALPDRADRVGVDRRRRGDARRRGRAPRSGDQLRDRQFRRRLLAVTSA